MAETNTKGAFWGFDVRSRQLAGSWPTAAYTIPLEARIWSSGGYRSSSTGRITVSSDTATAVARGTLPTANDDQGGAASGTGDYGWYTGGRQVTISSNAVSDVYRITYAADTAAAALRGPMATNRRMHTSTSNSDYGWQQAGAGDNGGLPRSSTERITYVSDTATGVTRGSLIATNRGAAATGNSIYGWISGGYMTPGKIVQRVTYATDTAVAVDRASVTITNDHRFGGATGNADQGWFSGQDPVGSAIIRITYATDTATPVARGPLAANGYRYGVSGTSTDGWWIAGKAFNGSPTHRSTVQRVTFATDTATASIRGPLHVSTGANKATSGTA